MGSLGEMPALSREEYGTEARVGFPHYLNYAKTFGSSVHFQRASFLLCKEGSGKVS